MSPLIARAVTEVSEVTDPYDRLRAAQQLDEALFAARRDVARIRRDAVNELRDGTTGYGAIARRLGITKSRVQQIATRQGRGGG